MQKHYDGQASTPCLASHTADQHAWINCRLWRAAQLFYTAAHVLQLQFCATFTKAQHDAPSENVLEVFAVALVTFAAPFGAALTAAHTPYWHIPFVLFIAAAMSISATYLTRASLP